MVEIVRVNIEFNPEGENYLLFQKKLQRHNILSFNGILSA